MSPETAGLQQAKMKEFMQLLPLTIELAGLPKAEVGKQFSEGQMEVRILVIKNAFKLARQMLVEIAKPNE